MNCTVAAYDIYGKNVWKTLARLIKIGYNHPWKYVSK
jgi:hypothetical protein